VSHPLFTTLKNLKGNARGAVLTEPLWGIPFFLYSPYVSIYMLALGLTDSQIGLVASISLGLQIFSALLSGAITDKLGRKRTTFIFDFISWTIPAVIWAIAQNFTYFVIAAVINSLWRVTHTSWTCVLVEDTDPEDLVEIYSWIYIAGQLSVFAAPIAGLLINRFTLVPTMRGLYIFAAVMMSAKFVIMNMLVTETRQGRIRMEETKNKSIFSLLGEYRGVFKQILQAPQTLYTLGIMLVMNITGIINGNFWAILATEKIHIPAGHLAIYPFVRSIIMLVFFFLVIPRVRGLHFKRPMLLGFSGYVIAQLILINVPEKSYFLLMANVILEACSYAVLGTQVDRMLVVTVDPKERARIYSILFLLAIAFSSPFGWIAGKLSEVNRVLPFLINITLFICGLLLTFLAARQSRKAASETAPAEVVA